MAATSPTGANTTRGHQTKAAAGEAKAAAAPKETGKAAATITSFDFQKEAQFRLANVRTPPPLF